jgi:hypothetical protein
VVDDIELVRNKNVVAAIAAGLRGRSLGGTTQWKALGGRGVQALRSLGPAGARQQVPVVSELSAALRGDQAMRDASESLCSEVRHRRRTRLAVERRDERARRLVTDDAGDVADRLPRREGWQRRLKSHEGAPPPERHPCLGQKDSRERPVAGAHFASPLGQRAPVGRIDDKARRHRTRPLVERHSQVDRCHGDGLEEIDEDRLGSLTTPTVKRVVAEVLDDLDQKRARRHRRRLVPVDRAEIRPDVERAHRRSRGCADFMSDTRWDPKSPRRR